MTHYILKNVDRNYRHKTSKSLNLRSLLKSVLQSALENRISRFYVGGPSPVKPEFFQVSSFQPLRLTYLHCDDLHTILYFLLLSVIQPEFLLLTVIYEITVKCYNTF